MAPHALDLSNSDDDATRNSHGTAASTTRSQGPQGPDARRMDQFDLVCVGFGPANLALAIALHDEFGKDGARNGSPKVLFLERQSQFAWHAGMLLPGTKMQIHFMKDLATFRNPKSHFTFVNYLYEHDRLAEFTDMGTNLPSRLEYQDYMKWCASHFEDQVQYGIEVHGINPVFSGNTSSRAESFSITGRNVLSNTDVTYSAKKVIVGVGGKPNMPQPFPMDNPRVIHSSKYRQQISKTLPKASENYRVAVVGSGQSAAEIFRDLQSRYPNASTRLIFRSRALRPSDDSPFVNEIFHPSRVDEFYDMSPSERETTISKDRATNYSVVRLPLLEEIHENLYTQRIENPDETTWKHRLLPERTIDGLTQSGQSITLQLGNKQEDGKNTEEFECDAVVVAAGYQRDMHEAMLEPCKSLMPGQAKSGCKVSRDYSVEFEDGRVGDGCGVWLQGCNEQTHGLSDTLLSILAPRSGELLNSMFGTPEEA